MKVQFEVKRLVHFDWDEIAGVISAGAKFEMVKKLRSMCPDLSIGECAQIADELHDRGLVPGEEVQSLGDMVQEAINNSDQ